MVVSPFEILYEDEDLIAVNKPAGIPTMGVGDNRRTVVGLLRQFLMKRGNTGGDVFLGIASRLDTPVTGVLVFAKSSTAAAHLSRQFRNRRVRKVYWALVPKAPEPTSGRWIDWLRVDRRHRKVIASSPDDPEAREAITDYCLRDKVRDWFLLELCPVTGRKHQLRWQLALRGMPIVGDRKYGSRVEFPVGIALHAGMLEIVHPRTRCPITIWAPVPPVWRRLGVKDDPPS